MSPARKWLSKSNLHIPSNPNQNTRVFLHIVKNNLKIHMETQETPDSQSNSEEEEAHCKYPYIRFHIMVQRHSNKSSMVLAENSSCQWNRMEDPVTKPYNHSHLHFDADVKNTPEKIIFNNCYWENWIFICRKIKLKPYLSPYTES